MSQVPARRKSAKQNVGDRAIRPSATPIDSRPPRRSRGQKGAHHGKLLGGRFPPGLRRPGARMERAHPGGPNPDPPRIWPGHHARGTIYRRFLCVCQVVTHPSKTAPPGLTAPEALQILNRLAIQLSSLSPLSLSPALSTLSPRAWTIFASQAGIGAPRAPAFSMMDPSSVRMYHTRTSTLTKTV